MWSFIIRHCNNSTHEIFSIGFKTILNWSVFNNEVKSIHNWMIFNGIIMSTYLIQIISNKWCSSCIRTHSLTSMVPPMKTSFKSMCFFLYLSYLSNYVHLSIYIYLSYLSYLTIYSIYLSYPSIISIIFIISFYNNYQSYLSIYHSYISIYY